MEKNKKGTKNKNLRKERGITLVALVVTIILLLILASISITGAINGGLFEHAENAKNSVEISNEKEIVQEAFTWAEGKSKTGTVTVGELQKYIPIEADTTVIDNGDTLVVKFNKKDRYYEVENSGNVEGPKEFPNDKYAGDLSKGGKYDGKTDETAFRITCIEDLVEFSKNYGKYRNSYIKLEETLDFRSIFSYNDYTSKAYGDLNGDEDEDDIRTELTKQGEECVGFTPIKKFDGTFDGQNNKICNLYENVTSGSAGLFSECWGTIKNFGLKNINITCTENDYVGGIIGNSYAKIINCSVEGDIYLKSESLKGLIAGLQRNNDIENCYSIGQLEIEGGTSGRFGGIVAQAQNANIKRCFNIMEIEGDCVVAGIVSSFQRVNSEETFTIEECFHIGDIEGKSASGIITGTVGAQDIKNCYSIGNISNKINNTLAVGGISSGISYGDIYNSYSIGKMQDGTINKSAIVGENNGGHIVHCFARREDFVGLPEGTLDVKKYLTGFNNTWSGGHKDKAQIGTDCNIFTDEELKTQNFVDELNILKVADDEGVITESEQSVWKMDTEGINDGYPIFTWQTKGKTKH